MIEKRTQQCGIIETRLSREHRLIALKTNLLG